MVACLNPCFNGRWSRTLDQVLQVEQVFVLILVLMEDGLGPFQERLKADRKRVLILVLMEDGLGHL